MHKEKKCDFCAIEAAFKRAKKSNDTLLIEKVNAESGEDYGITFSLKDNRTTDYIAWTEYIPDHCTCEEEKVQTQLLLTEGVKESAPLSAEVSAPITPITSAA